MSTVDVERIRQIKTLPSLIKFLRDDLDWPIEADAAEDVAFFDYTADELGIDAKHAPKIREIKQLRPLDTNQPWGVFWVSFEKKRLPMVVLRRILGNLVKNKLPSLRKTDRPSWDLHDLLFISSYGEEEHRTITFAHFSEDPHSDELPVLRVLGWDDQNPGMSIDRVANRLQGHFRWPEDSRDVDVWRKRWTEAFTDRYREAIRSADELIPRLAELARDIRDRVRDVLNAETERGRMRQLYGAVQKLLIHDMNEDGFADMYAQTVAYGLLSASLSRPADITPQNLVQLTAISNPFLENLLDSLFRLNRGKFHFDVDEVGINDVLDLLRNTNVEAIKAAFNDLNPAEDPVIRFYEGFLKAYDSRQRIKRGVFFTPRPVVRYIVHSVHELLQGEFGLEDGLASTATWADMLKRFPDLQPPEAVKPDDPFVLILDFATGTATFLYECIELIERTMKAKWARSLGRRNPESPNAWRDPDILARWRDYVSKQLLPRLYGYEMMMAPYAIAHLKLALKLGETGYQFSEGDRLHVHLTNSLEPASDMADAKLADLFGPLAKEAQDVNEVKRSKRFTVVIGNPPYAVNSANKNSPMDRHLAVYKDGLGDERNLKPLNDDYVKFVRCAQLILLETGVGLLGIITNHSYTTARLFRAMRRSLIRDFQRTHFLDLRGEATRDPSMERDQNVFEIQQGVGVGLYIRHVASPQFTHRVHRHELIDPQDAKYSWLSTHTASTTPWTEIVPQPDMYAFGVVSETVRKEYERFLPLNQLFGVGNVGYQTHRDGFVIDLERRTLAARIETFRKGPADEEQIARDFGVKSNRDWAVLSAHASLRRDAHADDRIRKTLYRPFDLRYIFYAPYMIDFDRRDLMQHLTPPNVGLLVSKVFDEHEFTSVYVTKWIVESKIADRTRGSYLFPLRVVASGYLSLDGQDAGVQRKERWESNLHPEHAVDMARRLGAEIRMGDISTGSRAISDMAIFEYIPILNEISVSRCDDLEVLGQ
ncbi:MAG: hypothetical protein FJ280_13875 [Planctomycetes bacterium]|nr:hypothetical protein [Planctomycetota bacterium]